MANKNTAQKLKANSAKVQAALSVALMALLLGGSKFLGSEHPGLAGGQWIEFVGITLLPSFITLIFSHKMKPCATF